MTIPTTPAKLYAWVATTPSDARLDVRVPTELLDAVQAIADKNGWTLSFAVKVLLAKGRKGVGGRAHDGR